MHQSYSGQIWLPVIMPILSQDENIALVQKEDKVHPIKIFGQYSSRVYAKNWTAPSRDKLVAGIKKYLKEDDCQRLFGHLKTLVHKAEDHGLK